MRDLVEGMIEKLDYFEIECEDLKKDAYSELDRNEVTTQLCSYKKLKIS